MSSISTSNFYGLKLSSFSKQQLQDYIISSINNSKKRVLYGYSFGTLPYFKKHPEIVEYSNQFDILGTDGRGYYIFTRMMGYKVKSDMSIPMMVDLTLDIANKNKFSILLLGAKEEINNIASEKLRQKYPGIKVHDGINGYFSKAEEPRLVEKINQFSPNILLIGITSPKKEQFAFNWKEELNCNIIIPCGGVIDILAGFKKQTPRFIKKLGFAWFYRFVQEPRRLFKDSIINTSKALFVLVPIVLFHKYILHSCNFSIPRFYNKNIDAPIKY